MDDKVKPAVGLGLLVGACDALGYAAWHGFHIGWPRVAAHASLIFVVTALIVLFGEDDGLDDDQPSRFAPLVTIACYLVFAGTGAWALTGADLPNLAVFALVVSGLNVVAHLAAIVVSRRRQRDQLGL